MQPTLLVIESLPHPNQLRVQSVKVCNTALPRHHLGFDEPPHSLRIF